MLEMKKNGKKIIKQINMVEKIINKKKKIEQLLWIKLPKKTKKKILLFLEKGFKIHENKTKAIPKTKNKGDARFNFCFDDKENDYVFFVEEVSQDQPEEHRCTKTHNIIFIVSEREYMDFYLVVVRHNNNNNI